MQSRSSQCDIIVLGAGASRSDGAPVQNELILRYFYLTNLVNSNTIQDKAKDDILDDYFSRFWNIDRESFKGKNYDEILKFLPECPSFEEILGILDLAYLRKEYIQSSRGSDHLYNDEWIGKVRNALKYLISLVIDQDLKNSLHKNHDRLVGQIISSEKEIVVLSLNYDILIDNSFFRKDKIPNYHIKFDYLYDFGVPDGEIKPFNEFASDFKEVKHSLFKLHGSLNWLFCPTCHTKYLAQDMKKNIGQKAAHRVFTSPYQYHCKICKNKELEPVLIPPTFYKDLSRAFLQELYLELDKKLRSADRIFFCGYSFPDADLHLKYLFKRAELFTNKDIKMFLYNGNAPRSDEVQRFRRFFRHSDVKNCNAKFEDFQLFDD